jgi:hypothetical protein
MQAHRWAAKPCHQDTSHQQARGSNDAAGSSSRLPNNGVQATAYSHYMHDKLVITVKNGCPATAVFPFVFNTLPHPSHTNAAPWMRYRLLVTLVVLSSICIHRRQGGVLALTPTKQG